MYSSVLPSYDSEDEKSKEKGEMLNGDNPEDIERFFEMI